ncbi:mitochondrial small ribosomal subunit Rsm22-domain-containing protein [Sporodiniella umbellata]|nr:mitochondrial small ribosomal subunit Rsm22-domain-containing protein [Sporodiniella umbellata]
MASKSASIRFAFRNYSIKKRAIVMNQKQLQSLDLESKESKFLVQDITTEFEEVYERGSPEAKLGRKRIGCVELPKSLIVGINELIDQQQEKRLIRTDALRLYDSLRSTSGRPGAEPYKITYGPREAIAYTAGVMSSNYAAIYNVLNEVRERISGFQPNSLLDFGTGPGTAIWAAKEVFKISSCTGIDLSEDMLNIAEQLENTTKAENSEPIDFKRYLAYNPTANKTDLVISAFTLSDIVSEALQKSAVEQLWAQTENVLILMDRGTPTGFSVMAKARQWIVDKNNGHVVAPCSHDKPCPMLFSAEAKPNSLWCHFSQRVQRPPFLMKTKHSKTNTEDSKYSYVVFRKGPRPSSPEKMEEKAYQWPRLIQPPLKKNKHVVMDTCSKEGEIQRMVIPKSQGKIPYRDARKAMWGDLFPHDSKNKVVTRLSNSPVQ